MAEHPTAPDPERRQRREALAMPSREDRLMGALLGMAALAKHQDDPVLAGALQASSSLQHKHRLVLSDVQRRWQGLPTEAGTGPNALVRCVPLALWLRGPRDRITAAALYLAGAQDEDRDVGLGAALLCQWLRLLYRARSRNVAWADALDRTRASLVELELEEADLAAFMDSVALETLALTHPIADALHRVQKALADAEDFSALAKSLGHSTVPSSVQMLAGAVGGLWFGREAVQAWLSDRDVVDRLHDQLVALREHTELMPRLERWPTQTSASHPLPVASVPLDNSARVGVCPCPGLSGISGSHGDIARDLATDLDKLAAWGARHVVCLLRGDDLEDIGLANYRNALESRGITLCHLPLIGDEPDDWFKDEWRTLRPKLVRALGQVESVLVHGWDWDEVGMELAAELIHAGGGVDAPEHARAMVHAAVSLAHTDALRLDSDE